MTFTNRLGQDIFIKLSTEDEPKVLRASDSRMSFVCRGAGGPEKLQVGYNYLIYFYNNWHRLINL
jgi:vacuolar protein sorting-associated protein 13A/C